MRKTTLGAMLAAFAATMFTAAPSQAQHATNLHPLFNAFYCTECADNTLGDDGASATWVQTSAYHTALQLTKLSNSDDGVYVGGYTYLYPNTWQSVQFEFTVNPNNSSSVEPIVWITYIQGGSVYYEEVAVFAHSDLYRKVGANTYLVSITPGYFGITGTPIINDLRIMTNDATCRFDITAVSVNGHAITFNSHHTATQDCNFETYGPACDQ